MNKPCKSQSCPWGEQQSCLLHLNNAAKWEDTIFLRFYLHEEYELCNLHLMLLAILLAYWKLITNQNFCCRSLGSHSSEGRQSHDPRAAEEEQLAGSVSWRTSKTQGILHQAKAWPLAHQPGLAGSSLLGFITNSTGYANLDALAAVKDPVPSVEQLGTETKPVKLLADEGQQFHIPAPSS